MIFPDYILYLLVLYVLKSLIFGQYWPWQHKDDICPFCQHSKSQHKRKL